MEKIVVVSAFITLLITVSSFDGMASETVNVGNYSFTFNVTVPHQIHGDVIKTFDGAVYLRDWSFSNISGFDTVDKTSSLMIGAMYKGTAGAGYIYAVENVPIYFEMVFNDIEIQSHLNLTQSVDFFRDLKITRIKR